jgi:hypothetical protein
MDYVNIPEQTNGLTDSSDGSRQYFWTQNWLTG